MKKKLLSVLLSLAMVFTLMPMMAYATPISTVADVLNTVAGGFPISNYDTESGPQPPINAWTKTDGGSDSYMYIDDGYLFISSPALVSMYANSVDKIYEIPVTQSGSNYTADIRIVDSSGFGNYSVNGCLALIFEMNENGLVSVTVSGFKTGWPYLLLNGTYSGLNLPQTIADILPADFPQSQESGWINQNNGTALYLSGENLLHSNDSFNVATSSTIVFDGTSFKTNTLDFTIDFTVDFINSGSKLSRVVTEMTITGYDQAHSTTNVDGTYTAPKTLREILPNCYMWANEKGASLLENSDDLECFDQESGANTGFSSIFNETVTPVFGKEYQYELSVDSNLFKFKLNDEGKVKSFTIEGFEGDKAVLNGTYSAPLTVADILPEDFPASTSLDNIPSVSWKNAKDVPLFYLEDEDGKGLYFGETEGPYIWCGIDRVLIKTGNNYFTTVKEETLSLTFHMDDDEFYCVEVSFTDPAYESDPYLSDYRIFKGIYSIPATVSFNMNDHGIAPDDQAVMRGYPVVQPEDPTADGYTFGGWYKDQACTQAWNFGKDVVTSDMTLYAKWIENSKPSATISGKVTESSEGVPNAAVELFRGKTKVAAATTESVEANKGEYNFNNVENGIYNIVVTKADNSKVETSMVTVNQTGEFIVNVELPASAVNSKVEHNGTEVDNSKSAISQTVAGGLDEIAEDKAIVDNTITITLKVEPKADNGTPAQQEIKDEAGEGKIVEFLDLSLVMQINNGAEESIGDSNDELLTIVIPFDFANTDINSVTILRKHGTNNAEKLTKDPAPGVEGYTVDEAAGTITIYAKKFSDYAIAYDTDNDAPSYPGIYFEYDHEKYKEILEEAQRQQALIDSEIQGATATETQIATAMDPQLMDLIDDFKITLRTENQKRGVMVYVNEIPGLQDILDAGYKASYDFYRVQQSTMPTDSQYKMTIIYDKAEAWYLNTLAKEGKRYYYKVILNIKDEDGNVVAHTTLDQCLCGYRTRKKV